MRDHCSFKLFISLSLIALFSSFVHAETVLPGVALGQAVFTVTGVPAVAGTYPVQPAMFGPQPHPGDLVARVLVAYPDATACGPNGDGSNGGLDATDANGVSYAGSIILILRAGGCEFADKVGIAYGQGAAGVVIYNFADGEDTTLVIGGGAKVFVPTLSMTNADGVNIAAAAAVNGNVVMGTIPGTGGNMTVGDRQALINIMNDPVTTVEFDEWAGYNPGWDKLITDPLNVDGCGTRIYGVWCKNGRVESIVIDTLDWGGLSTHFNELTAMIYLQISTSSLQGAFPCLDQLTNMQYMIMFSNEFTSLPSAACLNAWTQLKHFWFATNQLASFPSGVNWPQLEYLLLSDNAIDATFGVDTSSPFTPGSTLIKWVDYSTNLALKGPMPSPNGCSSLLTFSFSSTSVSAPNVAPNLLPNVFDNLASLTSFTLQGTAYLGPVPEFNGCTNLENIDISNNQFSGRIPTTWAALTQLRQINLAYNNIQSPIDSIRNLPLLADIDLSHNNISTTGFSLSGWDVFVFRSLPVATQTVDLSYNQLTGDWTTGYNSLAVNLRRLNLGHNRLSGELKAELWNFPNPHFEALDFSYNELTGSIPAGVPYPSLQLLYLDHNPDMAGPLPNWAAPTDEFVFSGVQPYVCPSFASVNQKMVFTLDPAYYSYTYCVCEKGRYGTPPDCPFIPVFTLDNARSFTDNQYGNTSRRFVGIDTSWVFDGLAMATTAELHGNPLRVIYFNLTFTENFVNETDALDIHEGGSDLKGKVVAAIRGNDPIKPTVVPVFTSQATVNFRSRKETGTYFSGTISFSDVCPPGYAVDAITNQCALGGLSEGVGLSISAQGNLIVLAYVLSVVGGWTTFIINENVLFARSKGLNPIGWLLATGLTLGGASIWSWNGIAMPALSFAQDVPIDFDVTISMASIVLPMGLTFIGLSIASLDPFLYPANKNGKKVVSMVSSMTRESQKGSRAERAGSKEGDAPVPERQVSVEHQDVEDEAQAKFKKAQARKAGGPVREKLMLAIKQLNRYVFIGALFIGAAVVTTHWVWLTSFRMNAERTYNYGNDLAAILVVYGICVPVTFIAFFFRGVMWNFVAAFLFSAAQICCFFIDISGHTYSYALSAIYDNSVTLDKNVIILIACAVSAVSCFGFIGFNVIKLKVSRGALQYLLKKFKKEIQRMENEIQRERHVNQKMLEKLQAQQHALDLITYCTPTLSEFSVATCLAGRVEARVSSGAQLKYSQSTGSLAPFLETIKAKLGGTNDHLDPKIFQQITVPVLLSHPVTIELFKDEFVKHNAPETIMFWLNVQLYKKIKESSELVSFGREIIEKYISDKGEFQINISGSARNKLLDVAHSGHFDHKTFQSVETETINLMSNQYLMQFRATPAFRLCTYILEEVALQEKAAKAAAAVQAHQKEKRSDGDNDEKEGSVTGSIAHSERERATSNNHIGVEMNTTTGSSGHTEDASRTEASVK